MKMLKEEATVNTCSRGMGRMTCFWLHPGNCSSKPSITDNMAQFLVLSVTMGLLVGFLICLFCYALT
jgi:hypothetical protein